MNKDQAKELAFVVMLVIGAVLAITLIYLLIVWVPSVKRYNEENKNTIGSSYNSNSYTQYIASNILE